MKRAGFGLALVVLLQVPSAALAQETMVLTAPPEEYRSGGFAYRPPTGPGWRRLAAAGNGLRLVFAERAGEGAINMRCEFIAEAHPIPDPALVEGAAALAELGRSQQLRERGESLASATPVIALAGGSGFQTYTLVSKLGETEVYESFFVALAPDKSEYWIAKATSKEKDHQRTSYWSDLFGSLASLRFVVATP